MNELFEILQAAQTNDTIHSIELEVAVYHLGLDLATNEEN